MNYSEGDFAKVVQKRLIDMEMTQAEFAAKCGVAPSTVSAWYQGKSTPRADALIKAAEALDLTPNDLLGFN